MKITHLIIHRETNTIHAAIGWADGILIRFEKPIHAQDDSVGRQRARWKISTEDFATVQDVFEKAGLEVVENNGLIEEMMEQ